MKGENIFLWKMLVKIKGMRTFATKNNGRIMADKYQIPFINACIRALAKRVGLPVKNAFQYLERFNGMEFLVKFYPTLHLQSIDDTVDDLIIMCKKNGGALG